MPQIHLWKKTDALYPGTWKDSYNNMWLIEEELTHFSLLLISCSKSYLLELLLGSGYLYLCTTHDMALIWTSYCSFCKTLLDAKSNNEIVLFPACHSKQDDWLHCYWIMPFFLKPSLKGIGLYYITVGFIPRLAWSVLFYHLSFSVLISPLPWSVFRGFGIQS